MRPRDRLPCVSNHGIDGRVRHADTFRVAPHKRARRTIGFTAVRYSACLKATRRRYPRAVQLHPRDAPLPAPCCWSIQTASVLHAWGWRRAPRGWRAPRISRYMWCAIRPACMRGWTSCACRVRSRSGCFPATARSSPLLNTWPKGHQTGRRHCCFWRAVAPTSCRVTSAVIRPCARCDVPWPPCAQVGRCRRVLCTLRVTQDGLPARYGFVCGCALVHEAVRLTRRTRGRPRLVAAQLVL